MDHPPAEQIGQSMHSRAARKKEKIDIFSIRHKVLLIDKFL